MQSRNFRSRGLPGVQHIILSVPIAARFGRHDLAGSTWPQNGPLWAEISGAGFGHIGALSSHAARRSGTSGAAQIGPPRRSHAGQGRGASPRLSRRARAGQLRGLLRVERRLRHPRLLGAVRCPSMRPAPRAFTAGRRPRALCGHVARSAGDRRPRPPPPPYPLRRQASRSPSAASATQRHRRFWERASLSGTPPAGGLAGTAGPSGWSGGASL